MHTDLADPRIINPSLSQEDRDYIRALRVENETLRMMTTANEVEDILGDIGPDVALRLANICAALEKAPYDLKTAYYDSAQRDLYEIVKSIKDEAKYRAELWVQKDYGDE